MPDYTAAEIVDILLILGESDGNFREASRRYALSYPDRQHPTDKTIKRLKERAQNGRLKRQRAHYNYNENDPRTLVILAYVHLDPHTSDRIIEREIGIPRETVRRILKKNKIHAYHITLVHALTPRDMQQRMVFCNWALERMQEDPNFFRYVMFSDEATFKNNGELNRHNCHYYSDVNPHWYQQVDNQHRWSVMVWIGIVNGYLIGPYFFDENVTGVSFLQMLSEHLPDMLEHVDLATRQRMWLQLDGAAPHYALIVRDYLNTTFPQRWIGRMGPISWPARSPDLTSPDFFAWGFIKNQVFANRPTTREDMINRIRTACASITREVLLKTVQSFRNRVNLCLQVQGANFEQLRG